MRSGVLEAMLPYFADSYANASAAYAHARRNRRAIEHARQQVAALIGAHPGEIYFTSGGTESDNWALRGALDAQKGRNAVVTSAIEHHAVISACEWLASHGADCRYLPADDRGYIDIESVHTQIDEKTAIVSVMLANNEVGTIQPIEEVTAVAHHAGALMHTDAVQAAGHIPIDVNSLGVDLLSMSAHKFGGPKGIGALYIRKGTRIEAFIRGGEQEKGMRAGTENIPAIVGMGVAAHLSCVAMEDEGNYIRQLRDAMRVIIRERLPEVRINGDEKGCLPGHVHISIPARDASLLLARLDMEGIAASSASACAAGSIERSHVLKAIYPKETGYADLRFTIGAGNTMEEIMRTTAVLERLIRE